MEYELTKEQRILSDQLVDNFRHGVNSLVHAVCGSGKTEIVLEVIAYAIRCDKRVGFCVPRRDVIRELYERFKYVYKNNRVVVLYGGHTKYIEGDLVCLTTHQLFRYNNYFDLLIIDEIDAFPYHDNDVLEALFKRAVKGNYIMLSATPSDKVLKQFSVKGMSVLRLNKRFHGHPLPVPRVYVCKSFFKYYTLRRLVKTFQSRSKQIFIFCPTIDICESTYSFLKIFAPGGTYVHSKREDRSEVINDFRKKKYSYLVTTAVLERGVTIKDLQVIVFEADNTIYDSHALIQIAGRAGRKKDAPTGEVAFICEENTAEIDKTIEEINKANASL
ncbi:MAG: DEAD/DEAH box helicase [Bacilli bacterium]|nr:DEAD/DEAH box helicase [Bacilli bacterium]